MASLELELVHCLIQQVMFIPMVAMLFSSTRMNDLCYIFKQCK